MRVVEEWRSGRWRAESTAAAVGLYIRPGQGGACVRGV